jgi:prepilin-type N-terminal cleavage/methylation domain-containing protein
MKNAIPDFMIKSRKSLRRTDTKPVDGGFSLAEVLVTLAIIAILAAVLLPGLNSQITKGDAGRVAQDLTSIQTGAQAFLSDVHRYPSDVTHLTTAITGSQNDILGSPYPSTLVAKWRGPYLTKDVISPSGIGTISSAFSRTTSLGNSVQYLTVTVTNVSSADFGKIEDILDEGNQSGSSSTTGLIRWTSAASGTLTFLALPIQ